MKGLSGKWSQEEGLEMIFSSYNDKFNDEKVDLQDSKYRIQFDGVLLNYNKPKNGLEMFERLARLYEEYGNNILLHIKGAFNLIIYDKSKQTLLIANDALCNRSFYYYSDKSFFYSASFLDVISS